jgi:hypothetical protein
MADYEPRTTTTGFGSVPRAGGAVVLGVGVGHNKLWSYKNIAGGVLRTGGGARLSAP